MQSISTDAWVLYAGGNGKQPHAKECVAELRREKYTFNAPGEFEVLAEPLYGCWEGNMTHAIRRQPIDICHQRGEEKVVLGNAGIVRILKVGAQVKTVKENDVCLVYCNGEWDQWGYPKKIFAYDAPGTIGLLAKQIKMHERQLIPIPHSPHSPQYTLQQWAAFSLRYITAWANWKVAYGYFCVQHSEAEQEDCHVWGWGGGVALAELTLARLAGCKTAMIASDGRRLDLIGKMGMLPVSRHNFPCLNFNPELYNSDPKFRRDYQQCENSFLEFVSQHTGQNGVSIFVDFIGLPVHRATLKALARPGIITTAGWREGMNLSLIRALECMNWHTHVHTHYARYEEARDAVRFGAEHGWLPPLDEQVYDWEDIPSLAQKCADGQISSYFPIYAVNKP